MTEPSGGQTSRGFGMVKVFPDLTDDLLLNLFHKGAKVTWTSRDLDWEAPPLSERKREALAHLLTPIYLGEQTAMAGAAGILPHVLLSGETTASLYLTSFMMDEARHFEALTRLYRHMGQEPLSIRRNPVFLRYHHRVRGGDRVDWVWGILFSDVIAKHFYRAFGTGQSDPLFGNMSRRILTDESRHLAFADGYMRRQVPLMSPERRQALLDMRDDLYRILEDMAERLRPDGYEFGIEADDWVAGIGAEVEKFAQRAGLTGGRPPEPPEPPDGVEPAEAPPPPAPSKKTTVISLGSAASKVADTAARCFGCLLATLCGRQAGMQPA